MAVITAFLGIDEPATIEKRADAVQMTDRFGVGAHGYRELVAIGSVDNSTPNNYADVYTAPPGSADAGLNVRLVPQATTEVAKVAQGTPGSAWPVKSTDAAGVFQQAITSAGDAKVTLDNEAVVLGAGTANIGDVDIVTMPSLPAGSAKIGAVDLDSDATIASAVPAVGQYVAGTDGTNARGLKTDSQGELQVDVLTANLNVIGGTSVVSGGTAGTLAVGGILDGDAAITGGNEKPIGVGGRASSAIPTAVSTDGDKVWFWMNRSGAGVVTQAPHVGLIADPWTLTNECAQYTTTQTSTVLVVGGASEKIVVTRVQIQVGGTTAGLLFLYFGTGAYVRGTNLAIFDGEFAPSATLKPGVILTGPFIPSTNGDDLMVTTTGPLNPVTINVWYYVVT